MIAQEDIGSGLWGWIVGIYGEWLRTDPFELHGVDKDAWDDP
jgi:hypothetical protein